jgi:ubiquinone/menaquinone biosynthesis C-methylase UbiE
MSMQNRELPFVREMFDSIAPRYDLLNRLLSLRQDVVWRKKMVSSMALPDKGRVLDVACGTGDVAMEIVRQKGPLVKVTGIDFSPGMLRLARNKISRNPTPAIGLLAGDALALPFGEASFHAVTIAFGIRNIQDKKAALKAFYDSLLPGGDGAGAGTGHPETNTPAGCLPGLFSTGAADHRPPFLQTQLRLFLPARIGLPVFPLPMYSCPSWQARALIKSPAGA